MVIRVLVAATTTTSLHCLMFNVPLLKVLSDDLEYWVYRKVNNAYATAEEDLRQGASSRGQRTPVLLPAISPQHIWMVGVPMVVGEVEAHYGAVCLEGAGGGSLTRRHYGS